MSRADGGLRAVLKDHLKKPDWRLTPIETGGTHNGVPDLYYLHRPTGSHGWIECKKTDGWAIKFEPHQVSWLGLHGAAGVRCWIAVRASGAGSAAGRGDSLWLAQGGNAREMQEEGGLLSCSGWISWLGPPASWDWAAISEILTQ